MTWIGKVMFLLRSAILSLSLTLSLYIYIYIYINNSIKPQSFVYTHLNDQIVLFQTIQFSIINRAIALMNRVFANGARGSIPGRVIPKTQKMVFDTALHSAL